MSIGYQGSVPGKGVPERTAEIERTFAGTDPDAVQGLLSKSAIRVRALIAGSPIRDFDTRAGLAVAGAAGLLVQAGSAYQRCRPTASVREGLHLAFGVLLADFEIPEAPDIVVTPHRAAIAAEVPELLAKAKEILSSDLQDDDLGNVYVGGAGCFISEAALALAMTRPNLLGPPALALALRLLAHEVFQYGFADLAGVDEVGARTRN